MKKIIFALAALLSISAAAIAADKDNAAAVKAIKDRDLTITVNYIIPTGMPSINSTDGYSVTIKDGKINGYLPYFGTATTALVPGADEMGIRFEDCPIEINENTKKANKGKYEWSFKAVSGNETVDVNITLFTNGSASMSMTMSSRSSISYDGTFAE